MTRKTGLDSLEDEITEVVDTQSAVIDTQPQITRENRITGIGSAFTQTDLQKQEAQLEAGMISILKGLPDNGRIVQDPNTRQLYFISDGYTTSNQDEIKRIIDMASKGEQVQPTQEAISRGKQWFFEEKAPRQFEQYYGMPEGTGTLPTQAGLLSQQFLRGTAGSGSWFDEMLTDTPQEKQRYERLREDYAGEYPVSSTVAQLGGLGTSIVGGSQLFSGAQKFNKIKDVVDNARKWYQSLPPLGQRAVQIGGTTLGAGAEGLIYGAGEGDTLDERTISALQTGGLNMAITAPIATVFPMIGSLVNRFKPIEQQAQQIATEFGIGVESARMIKQYFDNGLSLADMMQQVERSGNDALMVDATTAFERLLDASKSAPSASEKVNQAITGRVEKQSEELGEEIDVTLGAKPQGTQTIIEKVGKETLGDRSVAYAKAYDHVIDFQSPKGQVIKSVLNRVDPKEMEKAITNANKMLRDKGWQPFQVMARFDKFGNLSLEKDLNMVQLDYIKRGLDSLGQEVNNIGQFTDDAIRAQGQARDLRNALVDHNPDYGKALAIGQGKIKTQQAIALGSKLLKENTTLDDVKRMVSGASKDELAGVKQGLREQIENIMSNAKVASGQKTEQEVKASMKLVTDLSSRANQDKVRLILGEATANALFKRLDQVKKSLEVQTGIRFGSPTQPRQEIIRQIDELVEGGAIKTFFLNNPKTAFRKIGDFFVGKSEDYIYEERERVINDMVKVLSASDIKGKTVEQALKYLDKVRRGETLTKPQASWLTTNIKKGLESQGVSLGVGVESQRQGVGQ